MRINYYIYTFNNTKDMSKIINGTVLYTVAEVAEKLEVDKRTVYNKIKVRELPARRIGRPFFISESALNKYLTN